MKLSHYSTVVALAWCLPMLAAAHGLAIASVLNDESASEESSPFLATSKSETVALMDTAYMDAWSILSGDNPCSRFFGGPMTATLILDKLVNRMQIGNILNPTVGISMFGTIAYGTDFRTGISYRLFEKVKVNASGPFYRERTYLGQMPYIGIFQANTREARAAMLLHELAHLIRKADGNWLIADDGGNTERSRLNTATIEANCKEQIKALKNSSAASQATNPLAPATHANRKTS